MDRDACRWHDRRRFDIGLSSTATGQLERRTGLPGHPDLQFCQGRIVPRLFVVIFLPDLPVGRIELFCWYRTCDLSGDALRLGRLKSRPADQAATNSLFA
jgi:hypothetical protein